MRERCVASLPLQKNHEISINDMPQVAVSIVNNAIPAVVHINIPSGSTEDTDTSGPIDLTVGLEPETACASQTCKLLRLRSNLGKRPVFKKALRFQALSLEHATQ